jgi:beta-glucosidase
MWATDGTTAISVSLRNDHAVATTEVVQVYLHDPVAEVARPTQQLVAAQRVELPPGGACSIAIELHADLTSYTETAGRRRVDPGDVALRVGASSTDIRAEVVLHMVNFAVIPADCPAHLWRPAASGPRYVGPGAWAPLSNSL